MCFNAPVSLATFFLGFIFSLILIFYGNPKYKKENIVFGIMLIFISSVQLMEYFLWTDINNKYGINHLMTLICPLLIVCQPIILYIIKIIYFKPDLLSLNNYNLQLFILNIIYLYMFLLNYSKYLNKDLITTVKKGHLSWPLSNLMNPIFYLILLALNMFYLTDLQYSTIIFIITYLFSILSYIYFGYHIADMWCFFGSSVPLILFIITQYYMS